MMFIYLYDSLVRICCLTCRFFFFFFSSRRRHTRLQGDWSSDVCSSDLPSYQLSAVPKALYGVFFFPLLVRRLVGTTGTAQRISLPIFFRHSVIISELTPSSSSRSMPTKSSKKASTLTSTGPEEVVTSPPRLTMHRKALCLGQ